MNLENMTHNSDNTSDSLEGLFGEKIQEPKFESLSCPPPIDKIKIEAQALEKMFIMAEEMKNVFGSNLEVYSLAIGNEDRVITDILIPSQQVTYTHIEVSVDDILEVSQALKERENPIKFLGWAHSHCDFDVFFSITDDKNQRNIFSETSNYTTLPYKIKGIQVKYSYGITVNVHRDTYGEIVTQMPCGAILDTKNVGFEIIDELPEDWDERSVRKIIQFELKHRVRTPKRKKYSYTPKSKPKWSKFTEKVEYPEDVEYPEEYSEEDFKKPEPIIVEDDEYALQKIDSFLKWKSGELENDELEKLKKILMEFGQHLADMDEYYP